MIQFSKLRINGFKSFVERTELDIGVGLNGVVGPNGCGKSNLMEAMRWVMGENSPKRMRGGGMEDVIFNGTAQRPPRNIAEVTLLLDNSARTAPAAYNSTDEIEVTRRIERDMGSSYKINGKHVRARDVQMLFADTVTGANSPALVSQGKITQIINAKPLERRMVLEESAGISGLFVRRHEAELRLRAADTNMIRIDDVLRSMEERLNQLKRQARQATRYRNVNTQIRQMEIMVAWLEWKHLAERIESLRTKFGEAETLVADRLAAVTQLTKTQTTQAEDLPALRQAEAEEAAALQAQKIALQRLEDEAKRLEDTLKETTEQLEQAKADETHETQSITEAEEAQARLDGEQKKLIEAQENDKGALEEKQKARDELEAKVMTLEERYTALMQSAAESRARKQSLEQNIEQNSARITTVQARKDKASEELKTLQAEKSEVIDTDGYNKEISELENKAKTLREDGEQAQKDQDSARKDIEKTREALRLAESKHSEWSAETAMLENLLSGEGGSFQPVLESLTADAGFEKALSRALGDALMASLDDGAPSYWRARSGLNLPALPSGIEPLSKHVKAPKELQLALSQIGLVSSAEQGTNAAESLQAGQALVSADGTYWRWDGLVKKSGAADSNAVRLEQKNKLQILNKKRGDIEAAVKSAQAILAKSLKQVEELEQKSRALQAELRQMEEHLTNKKLELSYIREKQARHDSEVSRLNEVIRMADEDIQTLEEVIKWDRERLAAYEKDSLAQKDEDTDKLKQALLEAREAYQTTVRAFDTHQQEQNSRKARLHAIADERINLQNRLIRSRERMKQLEERQMTLTEKLAELKAQPKTNEKDKETLLSRISEFEASRSAAAEKLAACETEVSETNKALKEAESVLSEAREARAHTQATLSTLQEQQTDMERAVREQFDMLPSELLEHAAIDPEKMDNDLETLRSKKEKLTRERESIGPVNLRADDEMQELEVEVGKLMSERNDLMQAIEELRGGINKINKEARERLLAAFEHVNGHFQQLFVRLFGGGQAHLALIDSEDPLGAGLEIFAQPPGKTLQSLSLLSGGEQTLASTALIFAMFLTNPSPICVLDEIDAPLDDANVDRVCDLLEEIAERGKTRFMVITHHRMTMARMDRLYGVTMAEKGVSQLVSVDLQQSFDFLEAA